MSGDPTNPATRAAKLPAPVTVRYGGRTWRLSGGGELTFGRGIDVDLQLAYDPPDLRVSRHAGTLRCLPDTVLISNVSSRGVLTLSAEGAVTREIAPGEAITGEPHRAFTLAVVGDYGQTYELEVDARGLPPSGTGSGRPTRGTATVLTTPYDLTPSQRRVLAALCAPLLAPGAAQPGAASARQIAQALELRPNYVRNVLKEIREQLSAHGVPGLVSEGRPKPGEDFRQPLAQWAIRNGMADHLE